MLTVTQAAAEHLKELQGDAGAEGTPRLIVEGNQLALRIEDQQLGDQVVEDQESAVLYVSQEVSEALDGATLDAQTTDEGTRLTLLRPEEQEEAGQ